MLTVPCILWICSRGRKVRGSGFRVYEQLVEVIAGLSSRART